MTKRRRLFDRLLLTGAVFMALMALMILVLSIRAVRESSQSFVGNLTFYASQVEHETFQLTEYIDRYGANDGGVTLDDVMLRFDILWSRVFNRNDRDIPEEGADAIPETAETIAAARALLRDIEPAISQLRRDDVDTIWQIKTKLWNFITVAHKLSLAAKDHRALTEATFLKTQLRQAYLVFAFILGTVLFSVLSTMLLQAERRRIRQMNTQLEVRVRKRTEALQAANAMLAAEVAERKRNQALALEREERLSQAAQLAKLGFYIWDTESDRCEFCSDQHAAAHGLTPREFIEKAGKTDGPMDLIHPEDRERVRQNYLNLKRGHIIEMDYRVANPAGIRRLREVARPIFDDDGNVVREIGSTLDVTEQHETEMKLFEAQRMDSIGKMTGGVAHDFNNLLAVILGNLELLREIPESEERDEMIDDAINATLRGRDLTMNMLSFARRAPLDPTELNLNKIISEMQGMLQRTLPENIIIEVALTDEIWTVMADRSLTESAILNLTINARDAMPDGGKLTIETVNMTFGAESLEYLGEDIEPGHYVVMAVTDTGHGIPPELRDSIFEPFFTTKAITKNSGLGLSMVQGFIRQTGGAIRVESKSNVGTTFKLFFRSASQVETVDVPEIAPEFSAPDRSLHVLLVEDEETVRKVLTRQMEQSGISVVAAAESASAELAFKTEGPFDLVISDIVMPGDLQGPALVRRLREFRQDLPAIFLSGYPQEATIHGKGVKPGDPMLMKPVGRNDLLAAIDNAVK